MRKRVVPIAVMVSVVSTGVVASAGCAAPADTVTGLRMNEDIFRAKNGSDAQKNYFRSSWGPRDLIESCDAKDGRRVAARFGRLKRTYDEMSDICQKPKDTGAKIPLR